MKLGHCRSQLAAVVTVIFLACAAGAGGQALQVAVDVPADLSDTWARLEAAHPLPPDAQVAPDTLVPGDRIVLERRRAVTPTGPLPAPAPGERVVDVVPIAPVGRLGEGPESVSAADLSRGVRVLGLDQIELPEIALGVDGRWPCEQGWQLFEQVVLRVEGEDVRLREWLSGIEPLEAEQPAWIAVVGAISPTRGIDTALVARGGIERVLDDTLPLLRDTALTAGWLGAPAAPRGARPPKAAATRFQPGVLASLRTAGFTWLGQRGSAFASEPTAAGDTADALAAAGIDGEAPGQQLSLVAVDTFLAAFVGEEPGAEGRPAADRRAELRELAGIGAGLVVDWAPQLQGLEAYRGSLIVHSLGTFLAPGVDQPSVILRVGVWRMRVRCVRSVPVRIRAGAVRVDPDPAALERLYALTRALAAPGATPAAP